MKRIALFSMIALLTACSLFRTETSDTDIWKAKKNAASINACGCLSWLGAACSYRHENPTEFTTTARLCEIFLKDYTNAPYGVKQSV